jgi:hypothetical protein
VTDEECKTEVLGEWDKWVAATLGADIKPEENHLFGFFSHLKSSRPELLEFGDLWERHPVIHSWLVEAGRFET